jgi:DNA-binding XRE family transcriptional regulator
LLKTPIKAKVTNFPAGQKVEDLRQLFATNLRRLRHDRKLSQEQLAHDAGVDRAYLSRVA